MLVEARQEGAQIIIAHIVSEKQNTRAPPSMQPGLEMPTLVQDSHEWLLAARSRQYVPMLHVSVQTN